MKINLFLMLFFISQTSPLMSMKDPTGKNENPEGTPPKTIKQVPSDEYYDTPCGPGGFRPDPY